MLCRCLFDCSGSGLPMSAHYFFSHFLISLARGNQSDSARCTFKPFGSSSASLASFTQLQCVWAHSTASACWSIIPNSSLFEDRPVLILYFQSWYDTNIAALNTRQYRYQSNVSKYVNICLTYFGVVDKFAKKRKAASSDMTRRPLLSGIATYCVGVWTQSVTNLSFYQSIYIGNLKWRSI